MLSAANLILDLVVAKMLSRIFPFKQQKLLCQSESLKAPDFKGVEPLFAKEKDGFLTIFYFYPNRSNLALSKGFRVFAKVC